MRMGNPAMRKIVNRAEKGEIAVEVQPATYMGIAWKSVFFAGLTIFAAVLAVVLLNYAIQIESGELLATLLIAAVCCIVPMLLFSIIIAFAPSTVKVLGSLFSLAQGFLLGLVVCIVDFAFPGVALAAILGTMIVFVLSVVMNKLLSTRVKNSIWKVLMVGFVSLLAVEVIVLVASLFTDAASALMANFWIQLLITGFCVFYAAVMLMWDLQSANDVVAIGADKRHEWIVAFSLVTTLVYLYIELLELLVRLLAVFGKKD